MDLKAFSKEDFDAKSWINDFLNDLPSEISGQEKDPIQVVQSTVLKLQNAFHETDAEIKLIAEELPLVLPRTLQDLELLSKDLVLLKDQMNTVGHDVRTAEKHSTEAMKTLFTLETIKQRMLLTEKALKETDNWISLTSDIDDLCNAGDSEKLSDRLIKLHKCFALLAPGLSAEAVTERRNLLSSLADRYEAIVSPALVKAFNDLDRETIGKFLEVFILIGRTDQLQSYYWRSRVAKYVTHWETLLERHSVAKFCYALSEFYVDLTRSWQQEVQWSSLLFDQPAVLSCRVLVELSKKLEPSYTSTLSSKIDVNSDESIQVLIDFKRACDDFTESVTTSGYLPAHSDLPKQLFKLVYKPLTSCFDKFQVLFEKSFKQTLDNILLDHVEMSECVQLLTRSEERILEKALLVKENCENVLDGYIAPVFIPAYENFLVEYFGEIKRVTINLRERIFSKILNFDGISPDHWSVVNNCIRITVIVGSCSLDLNGKAAELCQEIASYNPAILERSKSGSTSGESVSLFIDSLVQECPKFRQLLRSYLSATSGDDKVKAILAKCASGIATLSTAVCTLVLDVLTRPAMSHLKSLMTDQAGQQAQIHSAVSSDDLPDYSFAPQHQVAELGQYLLTLPHHLDTFGSGNERKLVEALRLCSHPAIVADRQQSQQARPSSSSDPDYSPQTSELLLEPISRILTDELIQMLQKSNFKCSTASMSKQLATDIDYLLGVFDDLGQMPPSAIKLKQLSGCLRSGSISGEGPESLSVDMLKLAKQLLVQSD